MGLTLSRFQLLDTIFMFYFDSIAKLVKQFKRTYKDAMNKEVTHFVTIFT